MPACGLSIPVLEGFETIYLSIAPRSYREVPFPITIHIGLGLRDPLRELESGQKAYSQGDRLFDL